MYRIKLSLYRTEQFVWTPYPLEFIPRIGDVLNINLFNKKYGIENAFFVVHEVTVVYKDDLSGVECFHIIVKQKSF